MAKRGEVATRARWLLESLRRREEEDHVRKLIALSIAFAACLAARPARAALCGSLVLTDAS